MELTDEVVYAPESVATDTDINTANPWNILIADDEGMIHMITEMALKDYTFEDKPLKIFNAYSAEQMLDTLKELPENEKIAVILLDVVMESLDAGLAAVPVVRDGNREVRIVIRTGQSGSKTESHIINNYDINDFHEKTEINHEKLINIITLALRNYRDIIANGPI